MTLIKNVKFYQDNQQVEASIFVEGNKIKRIVDQYDLRTLDELNEQVIDGKGCLLIPGFFTVG